MSTLSFLYSHVPANLSIGTSVDGNSAVYLLASHHSKDFFNMLYILSVVDLRYNKLNTDSISYLFLGKIFRVSSLSNLPLFSKPLLNQVCPG